MKNITYIMAFAMLLAFSCQKTELQDEAMPGDEKHSQTLTVGAAETKVGFDQNNSFYWHRGDRIAVLTSDGFKEMILDDSYHGRSSGVFTGEFTEEIGDYVLYPFAEHTLTSGQLTYILPDTYAYASIAAEDNSFNPPMFGYVSNGGAMLTHLGSFFKISVNNIPAGGDDMKFVFAADKRITGGFEVDLSADPPVITTDNGQGNTVTINFSNDVPKAAGVFYVPAPVGTYGIINVEIKDGDVLLASKTWTDQTVSRKTPKKGSLDVGYVAEVGGAIYQSLQEALDVADNQVITLDQDVVLEVPLILPKDKTAVIDLNGNTISGIATSASASNLITVKGGADLTLKNGRVIFAATTPDTQWGGEGQPPYPGYANNTIRNEGVLTLEGMYLENKTQRGGASYVIDNYNGAKLTVNEGTFIIQSGGDIAIRMFNGSAGEIDVTINGGEISGYRAVWIQLASNNTAVAPVMKLNVNGGVLTSTDQTYNQAVYSYSYGNDMRNVLINVTGGTFNGDIALTGGANKTNLETLNISGGTFNGQWGGFYSYGADDKALGAITVTGGSFPADPSAYIPAGYGAVEIDGRWVVGPNE
jgi:hypothetical protein